MCEEERSRPGILLLSRSIETDRPVNKSVFNWNLFRVCCRFILGLKGQIGGTLHWCRDQLLNIFTRFDCELVYRKADRESIGSDDGKTEVLPSLLSPPLTVERTHWHEPMELS